MGFESPSCKACHTAYGFECPTTTRHHALHFFHPLSYLSCSGGIHSRAVVLKLYSTGYTSPATLRAKPAVSAGPAQRGANYTNTGGDNDSPLEVMSLVD